MNIDKLVDKLDSIKDYVSKIDLNINACKDYHLASKLSFIYDRIDLLKAEIDSCTDFIKKGGN